MKRILHLTLKRKWFDQIASREKRVEYREVKSYWDARLKDRGFDEVHFTNGYGKDRPFMRAECLIIIKTPDRYCIHLGEILELRNYEKQERLMIIVTRDDNGTWKEWDSEPIRNRGKWLAAGEDCVASGRGWLSLPISRYYSKPNLRKFERQEYFKTSHPSSLNG